MSIATEISRLQADRNTIRNKLIELGLATSTDKMDVLAAAIEDIINIGAVSVTVREGETYTIPKGYHPGTGTVSGVAGGGNYSLQSKTATPTKKQQAISPDNGYYGLSDVTVNPIPDAYQDVSSVTAAAADVLTGKVFVLSDGTVTTGTMPNNGSVSKALSVAVIEYVIPKGYHDGTGKVTIVLEEKSVTPTKEEQAITPTSGKVLSKVTVAPIPDAYQDVTGVTADGSDVLAGKKIVLADGKVATGEIPMNAPKAIILDPNATSYAIPKGYHFGTGTVKIEPEEKTVTPNKFGQVVTPSEGKVISKVQIDPIPDAYQNVTGVTAKAENVLEGDVFVDADGTQTEGAMPNNGDVSQQINGLVETSVTIPAGYTSGGTVSLTDDIEKALAAI